MSCQPGPPWVLTRGEGPLVAVALHHGHEVRHDVAGHLGLDPAERRREEDPFTGGLTVVAPTRLVVHRSRFEVDLNRSRAGCVYVGPEEAWGLSVWATSPPAPVVEASRELHDAFYRELFALLAELERRHGGVLVLDLHSYGHRRAGPAALPASPDDNPEINLGTATLDRARWGPVVDRFLDEMRAAGHDARADVRFRGLGELARAVHARWPRTACVLAVEVKKTHVDEWTGVLDRAELARVQAALAGAVPGVLSAWAAALGQQGPREA